MTRFRRLPPSGAVTLLLMLGGCGIALSSGHPVEDYSPLFAAATAGDIPTVRAALDHNPRLVRSTEWDRETLLHDAVGHGQEPMAAFLLDRGARVNAITADGLTPLHLAAQNGDIRLVQLLFSRGARINARDGRGWSPLDRATKWHHEVAANFLRSKGARSFLGDR